MVDGTGSGSCPVMCFDIRSGETSGSYIIIIIIIITTTTTTTTTTTVVLTAVVPFCTIFII